MSDNLQAVDQDQWLTIEQASELVERSQIAIRAFVQTTLEEDQQTNLLRPHEADDRPFSYLIHRSLLEKEFNIKSPATEAEALGSESNGGIIELQAQIDKLQSVINVQAQRIHALEANATSPSQKSSQPQPVNVTPVNKKDWLDQAIDQKEQQQKDNDRKKDVKKPENKSGSSMAMLWVALAFVTILALGAGFYILQKTDQLPF